jgi:hypothetical protein
MNDREFQLQCNVVDYIKSQFPYAEFRSDMGGVWLPTGLAVKAKKANGGRRAWPDFFIAQPSGDYHGLFIEIKINREEVYCKNGKMRTGKHIAEQHEKLVSLRSKGYAAEFGCGFDECRDLIVGYLVNGKIWGA